MEKNDVLSVSKKDVQTKRTIVNIIKEEIEQEIPLPNITNISIKRFLTIKKSNKSKNGIPTPNIVSISISRSILVENNKTEDSEAVKESMETEDTTKIKDGGIDESEVIEEQPFDLRIATGLLVMQNGVRPGTRYLGFGFELRPSFKYKSFAMGLKGFAVQNDLSNITTLKLNDIDYSNIRSYDTNILKDFSNVLSYIDFIKYSNPTNDIYLQLNTRQVINYGFSTLIRDYGIGENLLPALGAYHKLNTKYYKHEIFASDLSLNKWVNNENALLGYNMSFEFTEKYPFNLSVSNIFETDLTSLNYYPELGFKFPIIYNSNHDLSLCYSLGTKLAILPSFNVKTIYDSSKTNFFEKFPTFSTTLSLDYKYKSFSLKYSASLNNNMSMFVNGFDSFARPTEPVIDNYLRLGVVTNNIGFTFSYDLPLTLKGQIAKASNGKFADSTYLNFTYFSDIFDTEIGFRNTQTIDTIKSLANLGSFNDFLDLVSLTTIPYIKLALHWKGIEMSAVLATSDVLNVTKNALDPNGELTFLVGLGVAFHL